MKVMAGLFNDHGMSSDEAEALWNKHRDLMVAAYDDGMGPAKASDMLATQDAREAHEPGTRWSKELAVAFDGESDPNDKWVKDYEGQPIWDFFDDVTETLPPDEAIKCIPARYMDAFKDYCTHYGMRMPDESKKESHMGPAKGYSKTEGRFTEIKAAIKAAWSAAEAKWFRLDFQESTERLDIYPIASDNEGVGVNWGVLPEHNIIVQYATDFRTGNSEIEREMPYKDLDELEKIFVDEFKSMDETLEIGAENGADIRPIKESRTMNRMR